MGFSFGPEFFEKRKQLLEKLEATVFKTTRVRSFASLGDHPILKKSLGVSTKSLVHHWRKSGGPGEIPGYSSTVRSMAKAAEYMKTGGFIAIGIGGISSTLIIREVCTTGSSEECTRIAITEGAKFSGSALGGLSFGWAASKLTVCLGRSRMPSFTSSALCTVALVGGASYTGAHFGGKFGEDMGESLHDHFLRD